MYWDDFSDIEGVWIATDLKGRQLIVEKDTILRKYFQIRFQSFLKSFLYLPLAIKNDLINGYPINSKLASNVQLFFSVRVHLWTEQWTKLLKTYLFTRIIRNFNKKTQFQWISRQYKMNNSLKAFERRKEIMFSVQNIVNHYFFFYSKIFSVSSHFFFLLIFLSAQF